MIDDNKIYFNPGDIVRVRHEELANRPVMVVIDKKSMQLRTFKPSPGSTAQLVSEGKGRLLGIECFWFNDKGDYCSETFNTKDLEHYE